MDWRIAGDFLHGIERFTAYNSAANGHCGRGMDNDGIHKFGYRHRGLFADLLRLVAPELADELDFARAEERAEELPSAYVRPARGRFAQRFGDMAWRVPRRGDAKGGGDDELVVLLEFQTTVNRRMAWRMRAYRRLARERLAGREGGPPALLSIVLYNGSDRWTAPGAATGLPRWSPAAQLALAPFQGWDYVLLSLERLRSDGGLARLPLANRAAATLRLQAERTPPELLARFRREWTRFAGDAEAATRRVLHVWTGALLSHMGGAESALPALAKLEGLKGETEMATVSEALFDEWFADVRAAHLAEGVERGIERGIKRGIERERARGLARLRRQAAIKFGAWTAERLSTLLGTVAANRMESLGDRVGDWIVECEHGEELLARVSALMGNGGAN